MPREGREIILLPIGMMALKILFLRHHQSLTSDPSDFAENLNLKFKTPEEFFLDEKPQSEMPPAFKPSDFMVQKNDGKVTGGRCFMEDVV